MEELQQKFYVKLANTQIEITRNFIDKIDWTNRFIGIKGSRGVGKTTLMLQYLKRNFKPNKQVLYVSLDDLYFATHQLYELASFFYKKGGKLLALDEVHRYPNWANELKNIYDDMPELRVVFTGSSLLHLQEAKADLSRRSVMYEMPGLSFREFLEFETGNKLSVVKKSELFKNHTEIAMDILNSLKPLMYFDDYLNFGYYPFYLENRSAFHQKLSEVILTVLEVDIPQFASIPPGNIVYLKKLLKIISTSVPFKPNIKSLSERTGISVNTLKVYLKLLNDAEMVNLLYAVDKGINSLNKSEKIYLNNTNLMFNLSEGNINIGSIRETFFYNQLSRFNSVKSSLEADFKIDEFTFEIGGKSKLKNRLERLKMHLL